MSSLYILESANLYVGNADPTNSKHLAIQELKLPALEENTVDHMPGGARVQIEIAVGVNKLEPTFKLAGVDPSLLSEFGLGSRMKNIFTAYGQIVDRRTGASIELKAVLEGRLGKIEQDAFKRGELHATDYAIKEVTHYELSWDGAEKLYWDFWTNEWRVDGMDQNVDMNRILRIGG